MNKSHRYSIQIEWTGNTGKGTEHYRSYSRSYRISAHGKMPIEGSSDPAFRGDGSKYNPEELLLAALSSCHMLWYLHLCAEAGVHVHSYHDAATGTMREDADGSGCFTEVILRPVVCISDYSMQEKAVSLHKKAGEMCFIARSVHFPVHHQVEILIQGSAGQNASGL